MRDWRCEYPNHAKVTDDAPRKCVFGNQFMATLDFTTPDTDHREARVHPLGKEKGGLRLCRPCMTDWLNHLHRGVPPEQLQLL